MKKQKLFKQLNRKIKRSYRWFTATRRRKILSSSLATLILLTSIRLAFFGPKEAMAWWDDAWYYRKAVPVTNNTSAESNVYINFTGADVIDTQTLITAGKMQSDCGDLRFTNEGGNPLPYYIVSGCNTTSTVVHVNFETFPAGDMTIYYYYGNPSAVNGTESSDFSNLATNYTIGTQDSEVQGPSPAAYYRFDETSGTIAHDSSSNQNDGTMESDLIKFEKQINIIDQEYSTTGTNQPTDNSLGLIYWDADAYSGETVYFEAVIKCDSCSTGNQKVNAKLYTDAGNAVSGSTVETTSSTYTRVRSTSAVTLTDNEEYTVRLSRDATAGTAYVQAVRLIVLQSTVPLTATETQIELGDNDTTTATTSAELTNTKIYQYDDDAFDGTTTAYFEATLKSAGTSTETFYFNAHDASEIWVTPDNMTDGSTSTYATNAGDGDIQWNTDSTCDATCGARSETITKVELRAFAYNETGDNGQLFLRPVFSGGDGPDNVWVPPVTTGVWSSYYDITSVTNAEDWAEWTDIQNLDVDIEENNVGGPDNVSVAKVEIRVTYYVPAYAELYNITESPDQAIATASSTSSSWSRARSSAITSSNWDTTNDDEYVVKMRSTNAFTASLASAKIIIQQTGTITATEAIHQYNNSLATHNNTTYTAQNFDNELDKANNFDTQGGSTAAYFESTVKTASSGTYFARLDTPLGEVTASDTGYTRKRSSDIWSSLPGTATDIDLELKNSGSYLTSSSTSWLIIRLSSLGSTALISPSWEAEEMCIVNGCLSFDASMTSTVPNADSIDFDKGLSDGATFTFWIRPNSDGEGDVGQIYGKGTNTYARITNEDTDGLADLEVKLALASSNATVNLVNAISIERWHHIAISYDNDADDEIKVYINGHLRGNSTDGSGSPATDTSDLYLGGPYTANFHGFIDEFKLYPYERSADEVKTDYIRGSGLHGSQASFGHNQQSSFLSEGLSLYYKMDEASWGTVADSSGNANDGTAQDGAAIGAGKFGNGGSFDGTNDFISTSDSVSLSPTAEITVAGWVKMDEASDTMDHTAGLVDKGDYQFFLSNSDGKAHWVVNDAAADAFSALGAGTGEGIRSLAVWNGDLYVGGIFSSAGTSCTNCDSIAKWDGSTWSDLDGGMPDPGHVWSLAVWNGDLYVGGSFTSAGSSCANCDYIAKWNGSTWSDLAGGMSGGSWPDVYSLAVWNGDLYAGGNFTDAGSCGANCSRIAKWDGSTWSALGTGIGSYVRSLAVWNGDLYAGGQFTTVSDCSTPADCSYITKWDGSTWSALGTGMESSVYSLAVWNGDLYAGGNFTTTGSCGANCSRIAKWDGSTWSALGTGVSSWVFSLAVWNGDLYAGGSFTTAGSCTSGNGCNRIAKWDGSTWSALSTGVSGSVYSLAVWNGDLYAGGDFSTGGGTSCNRIAKWGTSANKSVKSSTSSFTADTWYHYSGTYDGANIKIYIDGELENSAPSSITIDSNSKDLYIAKMHGSQTDGGYSSNPSGELLDGSLDELRIYNRALSETEVADLYQWSPGPVAHYKFDENSGSTAYDSSGNANNATLTNMDSADWVPGKYGGALNFDGTNDFIVTDSSVSIASSSALTVSGWMKMDEASDTMDHTAGIVDKGDYQFFLSNTDGKAHWVLNDNAADAFSALSTGMDSLINSLAVWNGDLYAGGAFTSAGNCNTCDNIAKWDGSSWSVLGTGVTGQVLSLAVWNGDLVAAGLFTTPSNRIAKWNGSSWSALGTGMEAQVKSLAVWNGDLYAGGSFTSAGSCSSVDGCNRIAKWDGSSWSALGTGIGGEQVMSLAVWNGDLYAVGRFATAGSTTCNGIAKWDGSSWSALGTGMGTSYVHSLTVWNGDLYAGGGFSHAGSCTSGDGCNGVAKWDGSSWSALETGMDNVRSLAVWNGDLYAGGYFTHAGSCTSGDGCNRIAKWNGSSWSALGTGMGSSANSLAVWNGDLYVGGGFTSAGSCTTEDGCNRIAKWGTSANKSVTSTTSSFTAGQWYHYSGTYDGSNIKIYINGQLENTVSSSIKINANSKDLYIAKMHGSQTDGDSSNNSAELLQGQLDDIKIYNYARAPAKVIEDMNAGHPAPGSPIGSAIGHWRFDEGYGDTAYDSGTGGNNGNLGGATSCPTGGDDACPSWTNSGKIGKALDFDTSGATDDYVFIADTNDLSFGDSSDDSPFSISAWINPDTTTHSQPIFSKGTNADKEYRLIYLSTNELQLELYDDSVVSTWIGMSANETTITAGTWAHVVATYDGSESSSGISLYINGSKVSTTDSSNGSYVAMENLGGDAVIGRVYEDTTTYTNGLIDEVKIYDFELTEDQIKMDYNQAKAAVWGYTGTDSSDNPTYSALNEYCPPGQGSACVGPIAEWKFDENAGSTANDTSGNNLTGSIADPNWGLGKFGSSLEGHKDSDVTQVTVSDNPLLDFSDSDNFSTTLWIKSPNPTSNSEPLYKGALSYFDAGYAIEFPNEINKIRCKYCDGNGSGMDFPEIANTYGDGEWHHVYCVMDRDGAATGTIGYHLFVDNVLVASDTSLTEGSAAGSAHHLFIGQRVANNWDVNIDNVRIFNYARTPAQIAWDYNQGKPVGHWRFDECQGATAYDSSGNGNDGTITIGSTDTTYTSVGTCDSGVSTEAWNGGTTGKRNASIALDTSVRDNTTDDYVTISTTDLPTGDFTACAWFKTDGLVANWNRTILHAPGTSGSNELALMVATKTGEGERIYGYVDGNDVYGSTQIVDGTWYHHCLSRSGSSVTLYLNGQVDGTDTEADTLDFSACDTLYFGTDIDTDCTTKNQGWQGQFDEVKIYNYALTPLQIKTEYNSGSVRFGP